MVPVGLLRIRGELAIGAHLRATDLYAVGSVDPDHDAVMRIGGEAPGGGPILSVGIKYQVRIRLPATSDLNLAALLKSQRARRMVLSCSQSPHRPPGRLRLVSARPALSREERMHRRLLAHGRYASIPNAGTRCPIISLRYIVWRKALTSSTSSTSTPITSTFRCLCGTGARR